MRHHPYLLLPALLLVLLQLALALHVSKAAGYYEKYTSLVQQDSHWYRAIAAKGFVNAPRPEGTKPKLEAQNFAFFPLYPYLSRLLVVNSPLPIEVCLLLVAQLGAVFFWYFLMLVLQRYHVPFWAQNLGLAAVFAYPGSFFLITAYSESWAAAFTLGLYYFWIDGLGGKRVVPGIMACLATLASPRSLAFLVIPTLNSVAHTREIKPLAARAKKILPSLSIPTVGLFSCTAVFTYSYFSFGDFWLFFKIKAAAFSEQGFSILGPFYWSNYRIVPPTFHESALGKLPDAKELSQWLTTLLTVAALLAFYIESFTQFSGKWKNSQRFGLAASVLASWYLLLAFTLGDATSTQAPFQSMTRYGLLAFVFLVIWASLLIRDLLFRGLESDRVYRLCAYLTIGVVGYLAAVLFGYEVRLLYYFVHGYWAA